MMKLIFNNNFQLISWKLVEIAYKISKNFPRVYSKYIKYWEDIGG